MTCLSACFVSRFLVFLQCGNDFFLLGVIVETDGAAIFVFAAEYDFGDLVFEMVLYGSFQRSGTELYVISFLCDKVFGCIGELDVVSQGGDAVIESFELDVDDAEYRLLVELVECRGSTASPAGNHCSGRLQPDLARHSVEKLVEKVCDKTGG